MLAVSLEGVRSVGAAEPDGTMSSSRGCKGLQLSKSITALKERENLTTALAREIFGLTGIFPKPFFGSGKKRAHFLVRCLIEDAVCLAN